MAVGECQWAKIQIEKTPAAAESTNPENRLKTNKNHYSTGKHKQSHIYCDRLGWMERVTFLILRIC